MGWDQGNPSCSLEGLHLKRSKGVRQPGWMQRGGWYWLLPPVLGKIPSRLVLRPLQPRSLTQQPWNTDLLVASVLKIDRPYRVYQSPGSFSSLLICSAINKCNIWNRFGNQHLSEPENEMQCSDHGKNRKQGKADGSLLCRVRMGDVAFLLV